MPVPIPLSHGGYEPRGGATGHARAEDIPPLIFNHPNVNHCQTTGSSIGKTRLALEVAVQANALFPDGVYFVPLAEAAAKNQIPVFLFGTSPAVMARVGDELSLRTEGAIDIAGTLSPSSSFDPEGDEADAAIEKIRRSGAKICFVALGAPKQDLVAARARQKGVACCMVCIGAALDFVAGTQIRAPKVLRNNGLEWAWRLATNPRRLARRYAESAAMFAYLAVTEPFRQRAGNASPSTFGEL